MTARRAQSRRVLAAVFVPALLRLRDAGGFDHCSQGSVPHGAPPRHLERICQRRAPRGARPPTGNAPNWLPIAATYECAVQRIGIQLPRARRAMPSKYERSRARSGQLQCRVGRGRQLDPFPMPLRRGMCREFQSADRPGLCLNTPGMRLNTPGICRVFELVRPRGMYFNTPGIDREFELAQPRGMYLNTPGIDREFELTQLRGLRSSAASIRPVFAIADRRDIRCTIQSSRFSTPRSLPARPTICASAAGGE